MRDRGRDGRDTMADVSHANPHTRATLGDVFRRGLAVPDGGEETGDAEFSGDDGASGDDGSPTVGETVSDDGTGSDDRTGSDERVDPDAGSMADVDHTSRNADVNAVWTRGPGASDERGADR